MDVTGIIIAAAIVALLGLLIGILLGVVAKVFAVPVNEKAEAIREFLPGNNCGGCGFAGCDALAEAIANGEADAAACPVGGASVAAQIAEVIGAEVELTRKVAYVHCSGTFDKAKDRYEYIGNLSCIEAASLPGAGSKACAYGCLGYGSCVSVCEFNAIHVIGGVAKVDMEECKACGKCVSTCPKHLIEIIPYKKRIVSVACSSKDKGKDVKLSCSAGCIGCKMCEKNCPKEAIHVEDNIARIDYEKCINCGLCAKKCPAKVIEVIKTS